MNLFPLYIRQFEPSSKVNTNLFSGQAIRNPSLTLPYLMETTKFKNVKFHGKTVKYSQINAPSNINSFVEDARD